MSTDSYFLGLIVGLVAGGCFGLIFGFLLGTDYGLQFMRRKLQGGTPT